MLQLDEPFSKIFGNHGHSDEIRQYKADYKWQFF